jgi:PAS domain-containing protein
MVDDREKTDGSTLPIPEDEGERLGALRLQKILDTPREPRFESVVRLAADICETPMAAISFVDEARQWFKAFVGLEVCETSREASFCSHVVARREPMVVTDTHGDRRFRKNPLVRGAPYIRFYAGVPLFVFEQPIGSLCVLDDRPRELDERQHGFLADLAGQVEHLLHLDRIEGHLDQMHERFDSVTHHLTNAVFKIRNGDIVDANPAFRSIWSGELEGLIRERDELLEPIHPDDHDKLLENLEAALEYEVEVECLVRVRLDERSGFQPRIFYFLPVPGANDFVEFVGIVRDPDVALALDISDLET